MITQQLQMVQPLLHCSIKFYINQMRKYWNYYTHQWSVMKHEKKLDHIQKKEDVPHDNIKMSWKEKKVPTINVVPGE